MTGLVVTDRNAVPATSALVGTWWLQEWRNVDADGVAVEHPLGEDATGVLHYAPDGRVSVQIAAADRPHVPEPGSPTDGVAERAGAYDGYLAYTGRYRFDGSRVVHEIELCLFPNWVGTELVRAVTLAGNDLLLSTPPVASPRFGTVVGELRWIRS